MRTLSPKQAVRVIENLKYKTNFRIGAYTDKGAFKEDRLHVMFRMIVPDRSCRGVETKVETTLVILGKPKFDEKEILDQVRWQLHDMECHEVDEMLIYKGERIYDPHGPQDGQFIYNKS